MNESFREQRPLLGAELSDEESLGPQYRRTVGFRGRTRNKIKGAAAIITNWPDHWSSSVQIWWILIGMLLLTILVIYNVALTMAVLPTYHKNMKVEIKPASDKQTQVIKLPEVFMHVIIDVNEEIDVNKYLPPIRELTDKHSGFNFNLIFVVNDTIVETDPYSSDELNNEVVLDDMFKTKMFTYKQITKLDNINMMQISLSKYMSCSSLKKRWRLIQPDFIPFLIRAISIWDNSGIAFNPLTVNSENPAYIEKLHSILNTFNQPDKKILKDTTAKPKKTLNNIRDIIEALESDNVLGDRRQENLTEADTDHVETAQVHSRKLLSIEANAAAENSQKAAQWHRSYLDKSTENKSLGKNKTGNDIFPKLSMLPLFLNLILNKSPNSDKKLSKTTPSLTRIRKSPVIVANKTTSRNIPIDEVANVKPMILKLEERDREHDIRKLELEESYYPATWDKYEKLIIDLKGNIIASEVSCHAFIGTVFDNIFHKPKEENISEYLIRELSIFCKGVLSRCKGVDVILL